MKSSLCWAACYYQHYAAFGFRPKSRDLRILDALLDPARRLFGAERAVVVATHALNSRTLTCVRNVNEFSVIGSRSA